MSTVLAICSDSSTKGFVVKMCADLMGHRAWSIAWRKKQKIFFVTYLFSMLLAPRPMPKSIEI
jgi:hypothetical protein